MIINMAAKGNNARERRIDAMLQTLYDMGTLENEDELYATKMMILHPNAHLTRLYDRLQAAQMTYGVNTPEAVWAMCNVEAAFICETYEQRKDKSLLIPYGHRLPTADDFAPLFETLINARRKIDNQAEVVVMTKTRHK